MDYQGIIIRPPSEANSLILQVTIGCTHNKCTFCPTYKGVSFRLKSWEIIERDIDYAAQRWGNDIKRVFICDGDALTLKTDFLLKLFDRINNAFPNLLRIGIYGSHKSLKNKTVSDLILLKEKKLGIIYFGIESGSDTVLQKIKKGATSKEIIAACKKIKEAGIKLSVTVLPGIGGTFLSTEHAIKTGWILTEIQPDYVGALTVIVCQNTPLYDDMVKGEFILPDSISILQELKIMLEKTDMKRGLFMANHASNYLPLKLRMPQDKEKAIELLDKIILSKDESILKPEYLRAL